MDAEDICEVFDKEEIDKIYLNFSDPWPKDRHAKRRLPSREFLARYDQFLVKGGSWNLRQITASCLSSLWNRWRSRMEIAGTYI